MSSPTDQNQDFFDRVLTAFEWHVLGLRTLDKLTKSEAKAEILARQQAAIDKAVAETLIKLKEDMRMHTVPEEKGLITRSYLNNSIDFMVAALTTSKERKS